jgi:hypothetical protein
MSAKFYAVGSFHLPSRNLFVIVGDVLEGSVRPGMTFAVQLNPGIAVTSNVAQVEMVDVRYMGKAYVGLAVEYVDPAELDFWLALDISDETIELTDLKTPEQSSSG